MGSFISPTIQQNFTLSISRMISSFSMARGARERLATPIIFLPL